MTEELKSICTGLVEASITPRRISKSEITTRVVTSKDEVIIGGAMEVLGAAAEMYLIPPDEKIELSGENSIETYGDVSYDIDNELAEVGVSR